LYIPVLDRISLSRRNPENSGSGGFSFKSLIVFDARKAGRPPDDLARPDRSGPGNGTCRRNDAHEIRAHPLNPSKESDMAKGQKRNSREAKKPKASKPATPAAAQSLVSRGITSLVTPKKKG